MKTTEIYDPFEEEDTFNNYPSLLNCILPNKEVNSHQYSKSNPIKLNYYNNKLSVQSPQKEEKRPVLIPIHSPPKTLKKPASFCVSREVKYITLRNLEKSPRYKLERELKNS